MLSPHYVGCQVGVRRGGEPTWHHLDHGHDGRGKRDLREPHAPRDLAHQALVVRKDGRVLQHYRQAANAAVEHVLRAGEGKASCGRGPLGRRLQVGRAAGLAAAGWHVPGRLLALAGCRGTHWPAHLQVSAQPLHVGRLADAHQLSRHRLLDHGVPWERVLSGTLACTPVHHRGRRMSGGVRRGRHQGGRAPQPPDAAHRRMLSSHLEGWSPRGRMTCSSHSTTVLCSTSGALISRSKMLGRAWLPMCSRSLKPAVTTSAVRSPLRSKSALVATWDGGGA